MSQEFGSRTRGEVTIECSDKYPRYVHIYDDKKIIKTVKPKKYNEDTPYDAKNFVYGSVLEESLENWFNWEKEEYLASQDDLESSEVPLFRVSAARDYEKWALGEGDNKKDADKLPATKDKEKTYPIIAPNGNWQVRQWLKEKDEIHNERRGESLSTNEHKENSILPHKSKDQIV